MATDCWLDFVDFWSDGFIALSVGSESVIVAMLSHFVQLGTSQRYL